MKSLFKILAILSIVIFFTKPMTSLASDCFNNKFTSAQVTDMFRYGDTETSLFTGRLQLSIPIYSLDDPDFNLDVALRYNAEGFKPRKHSGYVGYNWFLEAGGCITREVRNYADETCRRDAASGKYMMGMLYYIRKNPANQYNKDSVYNFSPSIGQSCYMSNTNYTWNMGNRCDWNIDYLPDVFHFNFCGHQGSFMINNSGDPVIISGDYFKIDLSALEESDYSISPVNTQLKPMQCTSITLTSKDGYKYVFGGDLSSVEYTLSLLNGNDWDAQYPPVITSWHLKKVIAPNNRQVLFYYKRPVENTSDIRRDSLLELNEYKDLFATNDYFSYQIDQSGLPTFQPVQMIKMNMIRICILDSIVVSGAQPLRLHFFNRADSKSLYKHSHYGIGDKPCKLDSMYVISDARILRKVSLSYEYKAYDNVHYWRYLKDVYISGVGAYTLSYNHEAGMYQSLLASTGPAYDAIVDYYGYSVSHPLGGLLTRIDFPTGGRQEFSYEGHTYGKERKYVVENHLQVAMETVNSYSSTSGARISEIKTYSTSSATSPVETKQYAYIPAPYSSFNTSSGVHYNNRLIYWPTNNQGYLVTEANSYSMLDTHIGYNYIEETTKDAANNVLSKVGYTFDTGSNSYSPDYHIHPDWIPSGGDLNYYAILSGLLAYNSKLTHVGHLLAKDYYNGEANIRSELYSYNGIASSPYHFIPVGREILGNTDTIAIFSNRALPITRKLYISPDVMQQHVTKGYVESYFPLHVNQCYVYDRKLRVKEEYIRDSQNKWLFTKYTYPDDYALTFQPEYPVLRTPPSLMGPKALLCSQHRINLPIEIISGYEDIYANEYITAGKINLYESAMRIINLDSILNYAYLHKTLELSITNPITDYHELRYNIEIPLYDSRYELTCEYRFNSSLRLTKIAPFGGVETKYSWDGIYPVSKTVGNQTTTYTYIPYVGVSSMTDPRGITTYYTYDSAGRLIETYQIINDRKQIINAYQYHIKTE